MEQQQLLKTIINNQKTILAEQGALKEKFHDLDKKVEVGQGRSEAEHASMIQVVAKSMSDNTELEKKVDKNEEHINRLKVELATAKTERETERRTDRRIGGFIVGAFIVLQGLVALLILLLK